MTVGYKGLHGVSEIGFKKRSVALSEVFPTADEIVLSIAGVYWRVGESAAIVYELSELRFEVVETDHRLELAVPDTQGDYCGLIIDILACDTGQLKAMMTDVETACEFVRSKLGQAMRIMEITERDYVARLRDSLRLLAHELGRDGGQTTDIRGTP
jgi:hypothetical protein